MRPSVRELETVDGTELVSKPDGERKVLE